jgi:formylglycine-generating enzyme required for sulfatase activity
MYQSLIEEMNTMGGGRDKPGGYMLAIGATLGEYRIIRPLGCGGMGEVYEVEHVTLERRYALKLLPAKFAEQFGAFDRFRREALVMANLIHPHIVKVDDFGVSEGHHWLRMERANGLRFDDREVTSLQELAEAGGGRVEQKSLASILTHVLLAIRYAHGRGAVHCNLKPSNILIFADARGSTFKITDFGLVRLVGEDWVRSQTQRSVARSMSMNDCCSQTIGGSASDAEGTSTRSLLSTYEYMSPEQKQGKEATAQSDLYSVGLIAFKLLTGQNPGLKPPSRLDRSLDTAWDEVLERALAVTAANRWPDAGAMLTALGECLAREDTRNAETKTSVAEHGTARVPPLAAPSLFIRHPEQEVVDTETVYLGDGVNLDLVWCPAGSFQMGSNDGEGDEKPVRTVRITRGFWMGRTAVTQAQWRQRMKDNPSRFKGDDLPVEQVDWPQCVEFCRTLTERERTAGRLPAEYEYRLPSEAEWEYAARGGSKGRGFTYSGRNDLGSVGWYSDNSGGKTQPVGKKAANELGLYDMSGNVWEWCQDWYQDNYNGLGSADPSGPASGSNRVLRGGGWYSVASACRSTRRLRYGPSASIDDLGFRVVRAPVP